jgi:hypothetical protein
VRGRRRTRRRYWCRHTGPYRARSPVGTSVAGVRGCGPYVPRVAPREPTVAGPLPQRLPGHRLRTRRDRGRRSWPSSRWPTGRLHREVIEAIARDRGRIADTVVPSMALIAQMAERRAPIPPSHRQAGQPSATSSCGRKSAMARDDVVVAGGGALTRVSPAAGAPAEESSRPVTPAVDGRPVSPSPGRRDPAEAVLLARGHA